MIPANDNDAVDAQAPATVLREVRSGSGSGNFGAETQEAGDALAALAPIRRHGAPRTSRASRRRVATHPGKNAAAPVDANPSMMMSPDWDALEARPLAAHRAKRERLEDGSNDAGQARRGWSGTSARRRARALPAEMREFAGRVGSANDVEAAFGGRFMDRQPERWHRFNDGDAPLAADDFAAFLADIGSGSWEPNLNVDESGDWARGVLDGDVLFEIIAVQPKRCPAGMKVTRMPRLPNYIAHRDDDDEGDVSRWVKLAAEAERRKKVGPPARRSSPSSGSRPRSSRRRAGGTRTRLRLARVPTRSSPRSWRCTAPSATACRTTISSGCWWRRKEPNCAFATSRRR